MKIAVIGSRKFKDKNLVEYIILLNFKEGDTLVSGGAKGVDSYAEEILEKMNKEVAFTGTLLFDKIIFKPNWNKYGKSAGFIRNKLIIDEADKVIAFWNGKSKGTKHSINLALKANKPINIYVRN